MESMSNAPYLVRGARDGFRMGHQELLDSMVSDGLWCAFEQCNMGTAAELVASEYAVPRDEQDEYAANSHRKAAEAIAAGRFAAEILAVEVPQRRAGSGGASPAGAAGAIVVDRDESVRPDTTTQALAALRPAFKKDGSVTAGNAPPVNDGASALVVMSAAQATRLNLTPMARIVGQATSGLAPKYPPDSCGRGAASLAEDRLAVGSDRSLRVERGVLGAGHRGLARSGHRPAQGQCQRRRGGARTRHRVERRARSDDAAVRVGTTEAEAGRRHVVPGRRQRGGAA